MSTQHGLLHSYSLASKRQWIEFGLIFACWTLVALLMASGRILDPRGRELEESIILRELLRAFLTYYSWALLTPGIFWVSSRFSIERSNWKWCIPLHVGIALAIAVPMDLFEDYARMYAHYITGGVATPFEPWRDVQRLFFLNELILYVAVLAVGFAREYFLRLRDRQEEAGRLRAQLAEARLETLRMQINPHFLFNTLHAVSSLVERDPRGVRRMIARLSTLLRYTLDGTSAQEVPLKQELAFLRDYLEIQQIRFQGRLEVTENTDPEVVEALVPSLILQPIVENAIKHGVSKTDGSGYIELRAWRQGPNLCLSVRDNGPGLSPQVGGDGAPSVDTGLGIRNTRARLEALYGYAQSLEFQTAERGGLVVTITLPFHTSADLHTSTVSASSR